jgi:hypothetical protein
MGCLVAGPPCYPISIRHPPPPLTHVPPPPSFCTIEKQDSQKAKQNAIIKKIGQERDLEAQNPISHPPPILYCMYTLYCLCVYTTAGPHYCICTYSHKVEPERRYEGQHFTKLGQK